MCGIAGVYSPDQNEASIAPMVECLTHRGPDDGGMHRDGPVQLGIRRLAVIDLVTGDQPMTNRDGSIVVVYNGEIFNYKELTAELSAKGYVFKSKSDTEVLAHGFQEWGEDLVDHLNGQFAFAIWNGKRLFIARDRMGEKPLYYVHEDGRLIFASEIKAILTRYESAPVVEEDFWVYDTPILGATLFKNIHELPGGHCLTFDGRHIDVRPYWRIPASEPDTRPEDELVDELRHLLIDAVNIRMVADVPVGMFLSGGLDSAAIACIAKPQTAFSCQFPLGPRFDELDYAKMVVEQIGAKHIVVQPTAEDFRDKMPRILWALDQPIATASTISEFMLAEAAKAEGIKVILGGQGADEIFSGYVRYLLMLAEKRLTDVPEIQNYQPLARFFWNPKMFGDWAERYFDLIRRCRPAHEGPYVARIQELFARHESLLDKMGHCDAHVSLPSLLTMNDRACASFGLENRCPFLDHRIVEFAFRVPEHLKVDGYRTKHILRRALRGIVPDAIIDRKDKKGLVVPFHQWLAEPLAGWADDLLTSLSGRVQSMPDGSARGEFDRSRYTRVCLELWFRNYFPNVTGA